MAIYNVKIMNKDANIGTSVGEVWHVFLKPYADSTVSWTAKEVFGNRVFEHPETQTLDEAIQTAIHEVHHLGGVFISHWYLEAPFKI